MRDFSSTCFHCGFVWSSPEYVVKAYENAQGGGMELTYCKDHTPEMQKYSLSRSPHDFRIVFIKDGSPSFTCHCTICKDPLSPFSEIVWADTKGKPFEAYYCNRCKIQAEKT